MKKTSILLLLIFLLSLTACQKGPKEVTDFPFTATVCGEELSGTFTGTILEDVPNGAGTFTFDNGKKSLTYSGQWENGVIVGTGELEYDGYELEFSDTEYTGIYEGEAENGLPSGEGTFEGEKRDKYLVYEGGWKNGSFADEGYLEANEFSIAMGNNTIRKGLFIGDVVDGVPNGNAKFTTKNQVGVTYTHNGAWKDGVCHGYGRRTYEDAAYGVLEGNFEFGDFAPTPIEYFTFEGTRRSTPYSIIPNSIEFLKEYPQVFLNHTIENTDISIDKSFQFKSFSKNPANYGDKLIKIGMRIFYIQESNDLGPSLTRCLGVDGSNNVYSIYMFGYTENIYKNTWATVTLLPLDYSTYEDVYGNQVWSMAAAAVSITK